MTHWYSVPSRSHCLMPWQTRSLVAVGRWKKEEWGCGVRSGARHTNARAALRISPLPTEAIDTLTLLSNSIALHVDTGAHTVSDVAVASAVR